MSVNPERVAGGVVAAGGYVHPETIEQFEEVYQREYQGELESCDRWIKWCEERKDTHGINFYEGLKPPRLERQGFSCE